MIKLRDINRFLSQSFALTEKNLKLTLRFKYTIVISYISPILAILMPFIIMGQLFEFNDQFGPWTINNYLIFQFIAYNIYLLKGIILEYPSQFRLEKFWKTLQALMIAPFNKFNLLLGIFLSKFVLICIPFFVFFIICAVYVPISFFTFLSILGIYLAIAIMFSGLGLIMGTFAISNENIWRILSFLINIFFWASCLTYPFEIFPEVIQNLINLNPLYYIFDILRLTWIENNFLISLISYPLHMIVLLLCLVFIPLSGVYLFNKIFKKYGIVGY